MNKKTKGKLQCGDMVEIQADNFTFLGLVRDINKNEAYITSAGSGNTYPADKNLKRVHRFGHMGSQKYWDYHMMHVFAESKSDRWQAEDISHRGARLVNAFGEGVFVTRDFMKWWVESGFMKKYQPDEDIQNRWRQLLADVCSKKKGAQDENG
jgi:hypothetical protein